MGSSREHDVRKGGVKGLGGFLGRLGSPTAIGVALAATGLVVALILTNEPESPEQARTLPAIDIGEAGEESAPASDRPEVSANPFASAETGEPEKDAEPPPGPAAAGDQESAGLPPGLDGLVQPMTPELSQEEIDALHRRQLQELAAAASDPNRVLDLPPSSDSGLTMTVGELNALHAQQEADIRAQDRDSPELAVPFTPEGSAPVYADELAARHREEERQAMSSGTGARLEMPPTSPDGQAEIVDSGELSRRHDAQTAAAVQANEAGSSVVVLPPSTDAQHGITNAEIDRLHSEQVPMSGEPLASDSSSTSEAAQ